VTSSVFSSLISSHDWSSAVPRASSAVRATLMSLRRLYPMRSPSSAIFRRRSSALARMLTIWEFHCAALVAQFGGPTL
jgi:hypothetical protein